MLPLRRPYSKGFTLVEVLVAMLIALVGILMMFQIMENAESRKRTTAAGGDAQVAGSIAMYSMERDLRLAGNGFGALPPTSFNCTVNAHDEVNGGAFTFNLLPLRIIDGAAGAADQIINFYGGSDLASLSQAFNASSTTSKSLDVNTGSSRGGFMRGDLVLVVSGTTCGLVEITDNTDGDARTLDHATGTYTRYYAPSQVNTALDADYEYDSGTAPAGNPTARFNAAAGFTVGNGTLYNLGRRNLPRLNSWQITNGNALTVTDTLHGGNAVTVGEGIVDLQAEYGLDTDTPRDFRVNSWQSTAPGNWSQVVAVRVSLLARSQQYEKANVTTTAPTWAGGAFTMTNVDGGADSNPNSDNNWRRYRYRVYETTIPLRNLIWGGS